MIIIFFWCRRTQCETYTADADTTTTENENFICFCLSSQLLEYGTLIRKHIVHNNVKDIRWSLVFISKKNQTQRRHKFVRFFFFFYIFDSVYSWVLCVEFPMQFIYVTNSHLFFFSFSFTTRCWFISYTQ